MTRRAFTSSFLFFLISPFLRAETAPSPDLEAEVAKQGVVFDSARSAGAAAAVPAGADIAGFHPANPTLRPSARLGKVEIRYPQVPGFQPWARDLDSFGIDLSAMDRSVRPQDDLYKFVNGTWLNKFEIPKDKASFGAFESVSDKTQHDIRTIIETAGQDNPKPGSDGQKIADLYKSFMDEDRIKALGLKPITQDLAQIQAIQSKEALATLFGIASMNGILIPIDLSVDIDLKNVEANIAYLNQSGLGLPDREYYFKDDEFTQTIQTKYREYISKILALSGEKDATEKADQVFALEKSLAQYHWTKEDVRDPSKTYNKMTVDELEAMTPGFNWRSYLRAARIPAKTDLVVQMPSYFKGFAQVFQTQPLEVWKLYLKVRTLDDSAAYLPQAFVEAKFDYAGRTLNGQPQMKPRWERGIRLVNGSLGEMVGKAYVDKYFPASSKKRIQELVANLRDAYTERIQEADWLSPDTKRQALDKLRQFTPKIGYPDKWKDYSVLSIKSDDLMGNIRRIQNMDYNRMVDKLGKPVDRTEWAMTPATVNAYYAPERNEIVFPAAILQPPFFNPAADDAVNYGAIGAVIGHEMSHGFDDVGSQFDGKGTLRNWWTPKDRTAFDAVTNRLVEQYNSFEPLPGLHVNGRYTLGENIADLGGATIAFHAYQLSLKGSKSAVINGYTGEQRFFLGFGQWLHFKARENTVRQKVGTDPHSPPEFRVNGVVRNMPEFYKAFGVKEGDKLYLPEQDRVRLW